MMNLGDKVHEIKRGQRRIIFNDGRLGHTGVLATILAHDSQGMTVLFDDRADTNYIAFSDPGWMDFIEIAIEEKNDAASSVNRSALS